jgi:2-polyprenyl-6-methoxyphenol hydroxylase-like FAD-dependent oxidoreductase
MPQYGFAPPKVVDGRVILLGNAAQMASPITADGAYTAVFDAMAPSHAFKSAITTVRADTQGSDWDAVIDHTIGLYNSHALLRANESFCRSLEVLAPVCIPG